MILGFARLAGIGSAGDPVVENMEAYEGQARCRGRLLWRKMNTKRLQNPEVHLGNDSRLLQILVAHSISVPSWTPSRCLAAAPMGLRAYDGLRKGKSRHDLGGFPNQGFCAVQCLQRWMNVIIVRHPSSPLVIVV